MSQLDELVLRHRSAGLLIDANLLLLYFVGSTNKQRIPEFKRTQSYAIEDFELLAAFVERFAKVVTTPNVLTEVSNLATLHGSELQRFRLVLQTAAEVMEEHYIESRHAASDPHFERLGITDAGISILSGRGPLVLTDDLPLYVTLCERRIDAINFNHIRF
jgi:hypothetical protein